jgi:hypothetical protein
MTDELHTHSAADDISFHAERHPLKKTAVLLTIPCAIAPMLIAASGLMVAWTSPLLFDGDFVLFGIIYAMYIYGLILSYRVHRNPAPYLVASLHIGSLAAYLFAGQPEWSGYATVCSLMVTSIVNQYYRNGSTECATCGDGGCRY